MLTWYEIWQQFGTIDVSSKLKGAEPKETCVYEILTCTKTKKLYKLMSTNLWVFKENRKVWTENCLWVWNLTAHHEDTFKWVNWPLESWLFDEQHQYHSWVKKIHVGTLKSQSIPLLKSRSMRAKGFKSSSWFQKRFQAKHFKLVSVVDMNNLSNDSLFTSWKLSIFYFFQTIWIFLSWFHVKT